MTMKKITVAVRVRPFNQRENAVASKGIVDVKAEKTRLYKPNTNHEIFNDFSFDYSYENVQQDQIYEDLGTDVIESAFSGYNACIFAYGQTGSGKSFTMMGSAESQGLIPRICKALFSRMKLGEETGIGYKTNVSYLEIYNEKVKDLLGVDVSSGHSLKVREHPNLGPYVDNLSQHPVANYSEIQKCIFRGNNLRTTAFTNMNDTSSRSHAIFTITFVQADFSNDMPNETVSKIHLVDLAGSERSDRSGATGKRLKEGGHINKSLMTLGSVISALAEASISSASAATKKISYIPYRDSTLTWLLKDSLGGNSRTIMIAAISPADCNYSETLSTLRYANRAKNIINKPTINEDPNVKLIRELREEINKLKSMLTNDSNMADVQSSIRRLEEDLHKKEAQEKVLTEEWTEKWRQTQSILREEKSLGLRKSGYGVVLDSEHPHLVGIHDDISTGVTLYSLKEGSTLIGTEYAEEIQDIILSGVDILPRHCSIILKNGNALIAPKPQAQCWLNGQPVEEPTAISQGDILLLGRTNMLRYNNPAEAAKLQQNPLSRSRMDLASRLMASCDNLNSSFYCDDFDQNSPRHQLSPFYNSKVEKSRRSSAFAEDENKQLLETIENAFGQLTVERTQIHEHYKNKVIKLTKKLERLKTFNDSDLVILKCKEKEMMARKDLLAWEKDNEKFQIDIVAKQLTTLESDLYKKKLTYLEFVEREIHNLQETGKLDEFTITESTSITESSEILLNASKSLESYTAEYICETVNKNLNDINQMELRITEKKNNLDQFNNKWSELDIKLNELEKELEITELELKQKSLNLDLKQPSSDCSVVPMETSELDTISSPQVDCMITSDSGILMNDNLNNNHHILSSSATSSTSTKNNDCDSSDLSYENQIPLFKKSTMHRLREKIATQKVKIMKKLESGSNKDELNEDIEILHALQKEYIELDIDDNSTGEIHYSDSDDLVQADLSCETDIEFSANNNLIESGFHSNLARSISSIPYQESEHHFCIPSFVLRGAGKHTHYEYEIKINLPDARWTLLRRYSRFRELHLTMKNIYGKKKISQIPFPRRELFTSNNESIAKVRRRLLELYLRRLILLCSKIPQCPIYDGVQNNNAGNSMMISYSPGLTKENLMEFSQFFHKGLFESGKHGTG